MALAAVCVPHARWLHKIEAHDVAGQQHRTTRILQLGSYISSLGRSRIESCGGALVRVEYVSIMAWYLHVNTGQVAYQPEKVLKRTNPVIYFVPLRNGWLAKPLRPGNARAGGCARLASLYVPTARHPQGVLVPK